MKDKENIVNSWGLFSVIVIAFICRLGSQISFITRICVDDNFSLVSLFHSFLCLPFYTYSFFVLRHPFFSHYAYIGYILVPICNEPLWRRRVSEWFWEIYMSGEAKIWSEWERGKEKEGGRNPSLYKHVGLARHKENSLSHRKEALLIPPNCVTKAFILVLDTVSNYNMEESLTRGCICKPGKDLKMH